MAAFGLFGCGDDGSARPPAPPPTATTAAPAQPAQLPEPSALIDVLAKLSDPAVPGSSKLTLVEGATPAESAALENFAKALQDNHMLPLTFAATDVAWSDQHPANVRASVTITAAKPDSGPFTFPMEFTPAQVGWQLSRDTADQLLAFGGQPATSAAPSPAPTTAPPTPTR